MPFHVSGHRQAVSHPVGPGNLSLFSFFLCPSRVVPQSHARGSPLTVGRDCWDSRPILCLSRNERSLGQRGHLSVSRGLSGPPFYGIQAKNGFCYVSGASLRLTPRLYPQELGKFDPENLKKRRRIFFRNTAWPQYKLGDLEQWPLNGTLNYNTILQLDLFCRKQGKDSEFPYVQTFMALSQNLELRDSCRMRLSVAALSPPTPSASLSIRSPRRPSTGPFLSPPVNPHCFSPCTHLSTGPQ